MSVLHRLSNVRRSNNHSKNANVLKCVFKDLNLYYEFLKETPHQKQVA